MKKIINVEIDKNLTPLEKRKAILELAEKYGSPIYVMDEAKIRENCRKYVNAMHQYFGDNAKPFFASKKRFPASGRPFWGRKNGFPGREAIF